MKEIAPGFWIPDGIVSDRMIKIGNDGIPEHNRVLANRCMNYVSSGGVLLDGGAYIGTFCIHLIEYFAHIIAYEPISDNMDCLKKNVPGIDYRSACLSHKSGHERMARHERNKTFGWHKSQHGEIEITAVAIDDLELERLDLLKLDLEGNDYDALRGAEYTIIRCHPAVLIEEKLDEGMRASKFLTSLGMQEIWRMKHDIFFNWR